MWSFDALWAVADHGGVVDNGSVVKSVKKCFMVAGANDFYNGTQFMVPVSFINVDAAQLEVSRLQLYVYGSGGYDLAYTTSTGEEGEVILSVNLSPELASEINEEMRRVNKMDDPSKEKLYNETPFILENYGLYWQLEVSYTLKIKDPASGKWGTPSESYVTVAKNADSWIDD